MAALFWSSFCYSVFMSVLFCNHIDGEERAGCFILAVFLKSYDSHLYLAALPHTALGWSVKCDCVTS